MQKLFYNCDIITLEDTKGECLLTEDGVISFVGDLDEGKRRAAPDCEKIDLCGACLLPAFIDAHSHISQVAQTLTLCALHGSRSLAEIKEKTENLYRQHSEVVHKREKFVGYRLDPRVRL